MREASYKARKLATLLEVALAPLWPQFKVTIDPNEIYPATGWYRSGKHSDCCRWEATIQWDGKPMASCVSYDTMTDCCRTGIEILKRHNQFRVPRDIEIAALGRA